MAFDFKKEYKEFYLPKRKPEIIEVPPMNYVAVRGKGDPNEEGGAYKNAIGILYAIAYTIKMSKMGDTRIDGYFDFVVPPLEGFGGSKVLMALIFRTRKRLNGYQLFAFPISSHLKYSPGHKAKLRIRKVSTPQAPNW